MATVALLHDHSHPSEGEIRYALAGNICQRTGFQFIVDVERAASVVLAGNVQGAAPAGENSPGSSR